MRSCLTWTFWWSWSSLDDLVSSCHFLLCWFLEGFGTYPRMLLHHTVFTDIDSMFKTKLISYSPFGTLAQSHFYAFCFFADFFSLFFVTWHNFDNSQQKNSPIVRRSHDRTITKFNNFLYFEFNFSLNFNFYYFEFVKWIEFYESIS